jgi:hypothetical protein
MPPLHASLTVGAAADGNAKPTHDRSHNREIFLMLRGVARQPERAATIRARRRQRRVVLLIDVRGWAAMRRAAIGGAGLAPRPTRGAWRRPARKGRCLPMQRPARLVQIVLQPVDFLAQLIAVAPVPIAIAIRALMLAPQSLDLSALALDLALLPLEFVNQLIACGRPPSREHVAVMARLRNLYKYDFLDPTYG